MLYGLKVNGLYNPVGIDETPCFSWKMQSDEDGQYQMSYRLIVAIDSKLTNVVWDSGEVLSAASLNISYAGAPLLPSTSYFWQVIVADKNGKYVISDMHYFETGLMDANAWNDSKWISVAFGNPGKGAAVFRREFDVKKNMTSAKLYTAGLGVFDIYINGERVGRKDTITGKITFDELKSGFTEASVRKFYYTYDVSYLLRQGDNALSAMVTSGYWTGRINACYGKEVAVRMMLLLSYSDGSIEKIVTDTQNWRAGYKGDIISADMFDGETYDARVDTSWKNAYFDDSEWTIPKENTEFRGELSAYMGERTQVREDREITPVNALIYVGAKGASNECYGKINIVKTCDVTRPIAIQKGQTLLVDMGQNFAGWEKFFVSGENNTRVTVRHAEVICDNEGLKSRGNTAPEGAAYYTNLRSAAQTTTYIISQSNHTAYHPSHTYYGFRYLEITATNDITMMNISGQIVTTAGDDTFIMTTSDKDINQLISNIRWGQYSNYVSVPTDCPQRDERQGWTADTQNFSIAACYMCESKTFLEKYMQDLRDSQCEDGQFPATAPTGEYNGGAFGALGWADAGIIIPYNVWRMYGDTKIITDNYAAMQLYVDKYLASTDMTGANGTYGDWLAYESTDTSLLGVAYYAWDALLMSKMAAAIGNTKDAQRYNELYQTERSYFIGKYVNADGTLKHATQTACLYTLYLHLTDNEDAVRVQLVDNIRSVGNRMQTGFLGTEIILDVLTDIGETELAYTLLLQHENPSWLYSIDQGATTMWERWNSYTLSSGFGDSGMNSFNHYSYGSVFGWMAGKMAGICPGDAGFAQLTLKPYVSRRLNYVDSTFESPVGTVKSAWSFNKGRFTYSCTIPANVTAIVHVPCEDLLTLKIDGKSYTSDVSGIKFLHKESGFALFYAVCGDYTFTSDFTVRT